MKRRVLSPLGEHRALIRAGEPVRGVLVQAVGLELCEQILRCAMHAVIRRSHGTERRTSPRTGAVYAPPRSAVIAFAALPQRSEESATVRGIVLLILLILEALGGGARGASRELYLPRLAARLGRDQREIQRWLCALRCAGLLEAWQPPPGSASLRAPTGRCYNVYRLCVATPRELRETWAEWEAQYGRHQRATQARAATAPQPEQRRPSERGQAVAAALLAKYAPPD